MLFKKHHLASYKQVDETYGSGATFLIDFYHIAKYINDAALCCSPNDPKGWADKQLNALKTNNLDTILSELDAHIASHACPDSNPCYAYKCQQYMS